MSSLHVLDGAGGPRPYRPSVLNGALDAFGRLRVSMPETIFDSQQIVDSQPLFWDDVATGAGTTSAHVANLACTRIAVANTTASARTRQTFRAFHYQPGKSQLIFATFLMGIAATGITRLVGQGDVNNGLFLRQTVAGPAFIRRTFVSGVPVDNPVLQAAWNVDRLDGSGGAGNPSGITFDLSKTQILAIAYEWLGVGSVAFGFVIDAQLIICHVMQHANALTTVYMSLPDLPLRYQIINDGTGPAASFDHICSTVISEGGRQATGFPYAVDRTTALTTLADQDFYPLIAMRLRSGYLYSEVVPTSISVVATSNSNISWRLWLNPTITGTALSFSTPYATSGVETDVARTSGSKVTAGTGTIIAAGVAAANTTVAVALPPDFALGATIAGVADIVVLAVSRLTGGAEPLFAALGWRESR